MAIPSYLIDVPTYLTKVAIGQPMALGTPLLAVDTKVFLIAGFAALIIGLIFIGIMWRYARLWI